MMTKWLLRMYYKILKRMQDAILNRQYIMTLHAAEEMNDDDLTIFDIERVILNGTIIECQKDQITGERKYLIEGECFSEEFVIVVAKMSISGKLVIITVYKYKIYEVIQ
jgi:hypothetical protein